MEEKNSALVVNVELFTDGSANPNPGHGGYCAILVSGEQARILVGTKKKSTCHKMEMLAVLEGLRHLNHPCMVVIHTDSQFVEQGFLAMEDKNLQKTFKKYDLWQELRKEYGRHLAVRVNQLDSHKSTNHPFHKLCDKYARNAAKGSMRKTDKYAKLSEIVA